MEFLNEQDFAKRLQEDVVNELIYFAEHLTFKDRDERSVVLIGHLLVEEQLRNFVRQRLRNPNKLKRFTFDQFLQLTEALNEHSSADWALNACGKLNKIRNEVSHALKPADLDKLIAEFVSFVRANGGVMPKNLGVDCNLSEFRFAMLAVYSTLRSLNRDYAPRIPTLLSGLLITR